MNFKKYRGIGVVLAFALSASAHAATTNSNNSDTVTNNYATTNNIQGGAGGLGGNGGQGGAGGAGGTAIASGGTGIGLGGSAINSNDLSSRNNNTNSNLNAQGQQQGQQQGQSQSANNKQGQSQNSSNRNNNQSAATSYGSTATTASSQNLTVQGDQVTHQAARIPVATAFAPNQYPTAPCISGVSLGFQAVGFGASTGIPLKDENCQFLEKVRSVSQVLNQPEIAQEMMAAHDTEYAAALQRVADRKAGKSGKAPVAAAEAKQPVGAGIAFTEYTDPLIRARLGIAPLTK
jgi:hypothetical protein